MPTIVVNPDSGLAESYDDPAQVNSLLQSGYHVPLHDAQGNAFSAPYDEAAQLVQSGQYRQPTPEENQNWMDTAKYSSTEQQAKTYAEGALRGVFGPAATMSETALGVSPEDMLKRKAINPGLSTAGELSSMGVATLASGGLFGDGAAILAAKSLPGILGEAGEAASQAIGATGTFGSLGRAAVTGAVEGGLYEAQNKMSEAILGDPNATAEHMLGDIGLSAALGGGFGVALKPITSGISKALDLSAGFLGRIIPPEQAASNNLSQWVTTSGLGPEERASVLEGLRQLKPNVDEIDAAGKTLGVQPMEMQRSDAPYIQKLQQSLAKDGTFTGIKTQQQINNIYNGISGGVNEALGQDLGLTKNQVGEQLKTGLSDAIASEHKPISDIYSAIKQAGTEAALDPKDLKKVAGQIPQIEGLLTSTGAPISKSSPGYQLAQRVSEELGSGHLGTVNDLRLYAQRISQDTIGQPELRYVAGQINDKLNSLVENSIVKQAAKMGPEHPGYDQMAQLLNNYQQSKPIYAAFRDKLDNLGDVLGKKLRKGEGAQSFLDFLADSPNEKIADRLFTKNNAGFLDFLKENFPQQAELLGSLKKSQYRDIFNLKGPNAAISEINKLEPEIKNFLFQPGDLDKLKAADVLRRAFPKDVNPSGTAETKTLIDLFRNPLSTGAAELGAQTKKFLIENLTKASPYEAPLISGMLGVHKIGVKALATIEKQAAGLFGYGAFKTNELFNSKKELHPIYKQVQEMSQDPKMIINHVKEHTGIMAQHLPDTTKGLANVLGSATGVLAQYLPSEGQRAPLDLPHEPTRDETSKFNRMANLIDNPLTVMERLKDGTLTNQHVAAMNQVYPHLMKSVQQSVYKNLVQYQADEKGPLDSKMRLGLSTLFGQDMDSSLSGLSKNQMAIQGSNMAKQAQNIQEAGMKASKSGISKMKMPTREQTKAQQALERQA